MTGYYHPVSLQVEGGQVKGAGTHDPVLPLVCSDQVPSHVGAQVAKGNDILVRPDTAAGRHPKFYQKVSRVQIVMGVFEGYGLSGLELCYPTNLLFRVGRQPDLLGPEDCRRKDAGKKDCCGDPSSRSQKLPARQAWRNRFLIFHNRTSIRVRRHRFYFLIMTA